MLSAFIFHLRDDLDSKPEVRRFFEQSEKIGILEIVAMIVRMQANDLHAVLFCAASDVGAPVWHLGMHRPDHHEEGMPVTLSHQPRIHSGDIPLKECFKRSRPRTNHLL